MFFVDGSHEKWLFERGYEHIFHELLDNVIHEREHFSRIWFAADKLTPPAFSYQVNFPRLELVLSGEYLNQLEDPEQGIADISVLSGDALYIL